MFFLEAGTLFTLLLLFVRIGGFLVAAPFFGHQSIPAKVKIPMALLLAYTLLWIVPGRLPEYVEHPAGLMLAVGTEALTGILLGYGAQFIFWAAQYAGEIIGFQMGLAIAAVYNPIDGVPSNPIGRALMLLLLLLFISLDGHHQVLRALVASFDVVPLGGASLAGGGPLLLGWMGELFVTALRLAAPFMITIFLLDVALGVFARIAPQADLFSVGLPLKLLVGLLLFVLYLQNFAPLVPSFLDATLDHMLALIEQMRPA